MFSITSVLISPLLLVLLSALTHDSHGQITAPSELLGYVPDACMMQLINDVLTCAVEFGCFALVPTEEEIAEIPTESEIGSCADIEASVCPITSRCPECKDKVNTFLKCAILDSVVSQNVTALVAGCSLDCTSVEDPSTKPVIVEDLPAPEPEDPAPTDAPAPDVPDPSGDVESTAESTSGSATLNAYIMKSVAVIATLAATFAMA